jgi:Co/Zn/Cd efflux system component
VLDWLENTGVAHMVQESAWGYPIVLASHAIGMAILVGIVLMFNFRILGFASGVALASLKPMFRVALTGLVINVVSGTMLFVANAKQFVESTPFLIKITLLIIGAVLLVLQSRQVFRGDAAGGQRKIGAAARVTAAVATLVWVGVIMAGRLIAYVDVAYY